MKICLLILLFAWSPFVIFAQIEKTSQNAATTALYKLFSEEWERGLADNPVSASYLGDRRFNNRWQDLSLTAIENRQQNRIAALAKLGAIDRNQLAPPDKLNFDLFKQELEENIESYRYKQFLLPLSHDGGIQTADQLAQFLRFETAKDYQDWIARLDAFPVLTEQTIGLLREGVRNKILWARVVMERVPPQVDKQIAAEPEQSAFFQPFKNFPKDIQPAEQERLRNAAKTAISTKIVPSYRKLKEYLTGEYLPASFAAPGIWQQTNGAETYAYLARSYTTTDLTPEQIHEKGLQEVARIRLEMEKIKTQVGYNGDLQQFFQFLRTDKQFYFNSAEELLTAYRAMTRRIDPELVKIFKTLPRTPYGVVPIPDKIAPDTTTAYYNSPAADGSRAGRYYVNLYKPQVRPKYEMMALSLHEAVPGHHLQIALAQELGEVPNFRKYGGYTAFTEGWGLYAESLGEDMNLYDNPYSKFGQLTYEMWRAVRLVVDTAMHSPKYKWTRERAINYFRDNAAKTETDIINEIDRYISNPGQALAYKIGELKIKELRQRAKQELGAKFDIREFHDVVLLSGAVPLDILERNVVEYIGQKRR